MDLANYISIIVCSLCLVLGGIVFYFYKKDKFNAKQATLFGVWAFIGLIFGVAMNWHNYTHFGFLHIMLQLFFIYTGIVLLSINNKTIIELLFSIVLGILFIIKLCYVFIYGRSFYSVLPLQICNIASVLIITRPIYKTRLSKNKVAIIDNYLICFGFLGALLNMLIGSTESYSTSDITRTWFELITFETSTVHAIYWAFVIYGLFSGEIVPNKKAALYNFVWIAPLLIIFSFTNQIWTFNFFYTNDFQNPVMFLYKLFPVVDTVISGQVFYFNILYLIVLPLLAVLALYIVICGYEILYKKLIKPRLDKIEQASAENNQDIELIAS